MTKLPGRDALESELETNEAAPKAVVLESKVVAWEHRLPVEAPRPVRTLRDRFRGLFARR